MADGIITDAKARGFPKPAKFPTIHYDGMAGTGAVRGFGLKVAPSGSRTWIFRYTHQGAERRITIGSFPAKDAAAARAAAKGLRRIVEDGGDPLADRYAVRAAEEKDTVSAVFSEFVTRHLEAKGRAPRYVAECRRNFDQHIKLQWGNRPICAIRRREAIELLDAIRDGKDGKGGPVAANRVLALIRALFNFAVRRAILEASPVTLVERPAEERTRERTLSTEELKVLWPAMDKLEYPAGPYLRMLLVTGQRRSEVAGMRWSTIDFHERTWTLASGDTKSHRSQIVPLSPLTVSILESIPREGDFVFAGKGRRSKKRDKDGNALAGQSCPISGFAKIKAAVDGAVKKAEAELTPWTLHDLRRSAATHMARLGVSRFVIGRVLNHGSAEITAIYDRYEYLTEKRHALDIWASFLENLGKPADDKVVPLHPVAAA